MGRIAFQGEPGAYSEEAALAFFETIEETLPFPTFASALAAAEGPGADRCILPVENSLEGSVGESLDLLVATGLQVVGEVVHRINHCLLSAHTEEEIKTVYSHPQALGQCRKFIQNRGYHMVPTYDTAGSVKLVREEKRPGTAAIASARAGEIHGLPVLQECVEDDHNNFTRFLVLGKDAAAEGNKTSIIFSLKHEAGALYRVIKKIHDFGINLTKIESRPIRGKPFQYNFFVDFEGCSDEDSVKKMLTGVQAQSLFLKNLGTYPSSSG